MNQTNTLLTLIVTWFEEVNKLRNETEATDPEGEKNKPGINVMKLFPFVTAKARVFVPSRPFQPRLIFMSKARVYLIENTIRCFSLG